MYLLLAWLMKTCLLLYLKAVDRTAVELKQELEIANRQYNQNMIRLRHELRAEVEKGQKIEVEINELRELILAAKADMTARDNSLQDGDTLRSKQIEVLRIYIFYYVDFL